MALTKSMAYDHPAYIAPVYVGPSEVAAAVSSKSGRFAIYTAMILKSVTATVITAGGTANAADVIRIAAGGTALTTLATFASALGTSVAGVTTNATMTGAGASSLAAGDVLYVGKGSADGTGVFAVGFELVLIPGANITP